MTNLRQRIARLEADGEPGTVYFISDRPEGEAPAGSYAIGPEISGEEWAQKYSSQGESSEPHSASSSTRLALNRTGRNAE